MANGTMAARRGRGVRARDAQRKAETSAPPATDKGPPSVLILADPADAALRDGLAAHLRLLERHGAIRIEAGGTDDPASADIVLAVLSCDFLNSEQGSGPAMEAALERDRRRLARVVPVIARPCLWEQSVFARQAPLPRLGRPVSVAPSPEEALVEVARGVRDLADLLRGNPHA